MAAGRDQLSAAEANEQAHEDLGVPISSPVLRGRNWFLDGNGGVVEYGESVSQATRWSTYEYEIGK